MISNTARETNYYISNLKIGINNKFNSKQDPENELRVTPYLSGLRYPLIIEDVRAESYFSYADGAKIILQPNALLDNSETLTHEAKSKIYSYVIPEKVFSKFSHQVQNEVLSAEIEYFTTVASTKDELYRKDLSVARKYLIAFEKSLNDVILASMPPSKSALHTLGNNLSLFDIGKEISNKQHQYLFATNKNLYDFLTNSRGIIIKLNEIRNNKVHLNDAVLDHQSLINVRRLILGVGVEGLLTSLYKAAYKDLDVHFDINSPQIPEKLKA